MATKQVYLQGKSKWTRVVQPNKFGDWSTDVYLTPESLDTFKTLKVKNVIKKDEDGYYVSLRRPQSRMYRGKVQAFAPPVVVDAKGLPMTDPIGNGSDLTCEVEHYSYKTPQGDTAYAIRLGRIRVDNLVPFVKESRTAEEQENSAGLDTVPGPKVLPF
jgi:hypothetical protein